MWYFNTPYFTHFNSQNYYYRFTELNSISINWQYPIPLHQYSVIYRPVKGRLTDKNVTFIFSNFDELSRKHFLFCLEVSNNNLQTDRIDSKQTFFKVRLTFVLSVEKRFIFLCSILCSIYVPCSILCSIFLCSSVNFINSFSVFIYFLCFIKFDINHLLLSEYSTLYISGKYTWTSQRS